MNKSPRYKSSKSIKSDTPRNKSVKSLSETCTLSEFFTIDKPLDFSEAMSTAAAKFGCSVVFTVSKINVKATDAYNEKLKFKRKKTAMASAKSIQEKELVTTSLTTSKNELPPRQNDGSTLVLFASHGYQDNLVEISLNNYRYCKVPRSLMQLLNIVSPRYPRLTKFTLNDCAIDKYTIYELSNLLVVTRIMEISLDSTFLVEGNYYLLLQQTTALRYLSLCRCKINDEVCILIVKEMHHLGPGKELLTLNLSSNNITDIGAKAIAEILRSNRSLRYLDLADNKLTDVGASYILDVLKEFPLTNEEIYKKRQLRMRYLMNYKEIYEKCLRNFENTVETQDKKIFKKRKTSAISLKTQKPIKNDKPVITMNTKAEMMAEELLGPFEHPFFGFGKLERDGKSHCTGNFILCYLNLAYNNLTYPILGKLLEVVDYQRSHRKDKLCGLVKIVLDGNNLPRDCEELNYISYLLTENINTNVNSIRINRGSKKSKIPSEV